MCRLMALRLAAFLLSAMVAERGSAQINREQWNAYSAQELSKAAPDVMKAPEITGDDKRFISKIAWNRFLVDESFIGSGDLRVVQALVKQFAPLRNAAVDATNSTEHVELQFARLQERLVRRLSSNKAELAGIALYDLNDLASSLGMGGSSSAAKAELFVDWIKTNDWRALSLTDRYNLYGFINVDAMDRRKLSARWTATLTVQAAGTYTLRQASQYSGTDCRVKLFLDEKLVLDSTDIARGRERFQSSPLRFTAGQQLSLRLEMNHQVSRIDWSEGAPMVLISWRREGRSEEIIPSSAFTPPKGSTNSDSNGLKGEYYTDVELKELKATRIDPALDLVSSWPPIVPVYNELVDAVFNSCVNEVLDDATLAKAAADRNAHFFHFTLWRIAYRMTGTDRVKLTEALLRTPEAISIMTPEAMGRLMQALYMLPGKEHLVLFGEWASIRPQPKTEAGEFPGWSRTSYQFKNLDFYWLSSLFWQREYWGDVEAVWDQYLVRDNGECNLAIAYATTFAAKKNGRWHQLVALIDSHVDDTELSGDVRSTWYMARAFTKGVFVAPPDPLEGMDDLNGAMLIADSEDYTFWALQEIVARLSSMDQRDEAQRLIALHRARFSGDGQRAALESWSTSAEALATTYSRKREKAESDCRQAYLAELQKRHAEASQAGDETTSHQYTLLIENLKTTVGK